MMAAVAGTTNSMAKSALRWIFFLTVLRAFAAEPYQERYRP